MTADATKPCYWGERFFVTRLASRRFGVWHQRLYLGERGAFIAIDMGRYRAGFWYRSKMLDTSVRK